LGALSWLAELQFVVAILGPKFNLGLFLGSSLALLLLIFFDCIFNWFCLEFDTTCFDGTLFPRFLGET